MFKGGQTNPYDEAVENTTNENLTSENWELIMVLCDKVQDDGEKGARNVIAALLRRLTHRNPNVQLYTLSVAEALSKNCGLVIHREIASRSFTQGLERLVTDRTSHDKVRKRALGLIHMWAGEFENDPSLGIMEECFEGLRSKGYKYEEPSELPPPQIDDEIRRREEEELQRALEMSVQDKGGRTAWQSYNPVADSKGQSSGAAGPSTSSVGYVAGPSSSAKGSSSGYDGQPYPGGYAPGRSPSPRVQPYMSAQNGSAYSAGSVQNNSSQASLPLTSVSRVRALHTFEGTEQGELTFEKGDIIKVVDRNYKDWWRGQLKGRTGIFPVNYVELLPDPTPEEITKEAEQEAFVFAQAANIDKLLSMLRGLDPSRDSLADNEEIQELYHASMSLRPKIVKLIDKYSQKKAELVSMNESFVKARTMFDRMMEESLARHSGLHDDHPSYLGSQPNYRASSYGGYDPGYSSFPQPQAIPGYGMSSPTPGPQQYPASVYSSPQQQQPQYNPPYQSLAQSVAPYTPQQQATDPSPAYPSYGPPQAGQPQYVQQAVVQNAQPAPFTQQPDPYAQPQQASQVSHAQGQGPSSPSFSHTQPQAQESRQITEGPPYIYDPNATYPDANAQAWAQYYAQGGTDPTGAVYFISIPGVKEAAVQSPAQQPQPAQPTRPLNALEEKRLLAEQAAAQVDRSPTAADEPVPFYQAQAPAQHQSIPQAGQSSSHVLPQSQAGSGSSVSLGAGMPSGSGGSPTSQRMASHTYTSQSPTAASAPHSGATVLPQPNSPSGSLHGHQMHPDQQQVVYAPPYADPQVQSPHSVPEAPGYGTQFTQMQSQFAGIDVGGEGHPPAAAAQTA